MEMFASYNWLKDLVKTKQSAEEMADLLSLHGSTVEHVVAWGAKFDEMVVGEIVEVKPHPNADKLKLVVTDIGGKKAQIVCGGENVAAGMKVAVAKPGASVLWHGEGEPVFLEKTKIRGEESYGMICGASEIFLEKLFVHGERDIADLSGVDAQAGTPLAEALDLNDTVYEIEVTSNRVDVMSMEGVAREVAAIDGKTYELRKTKAIKAGKEKLKVTVKDAKLCPRYQAVKVEGVKIGPSPKWMQSALLKAGIKSISNVVDISNYVMIEMGQPLHAFDAAKVDEIVVRNAKEGEKLDALDDNEYELDPSMLVIADSHKPIALAGVMGGKSTAISDETTSVTWEAANFEKVTVRKGARSILLFSESQMRFEKGLSSFATQRALERAVELTLELAGGSVVSEVVDTAKSAYKPLTYTFDTADIERLAGFVIDEKRAKGMLERLGFKVSGSKTWKVEVPFWRDGDIEDSRDFVEEIARLYGYHNIEGTIPMGVSQVETDPLFGLRKMLENRLVGKGFSEMINYSMVGADDLTKSGESIHEAVHILNPLSVDGEYLRTSLIPSALLSVARNTSHATSVRMFEVANTYTKADGLPQEDMKLVCVMWDAKPTTPLFYQLKSVLDGLTTADYQAAAHHMLHPGRSAEIPEVGVVGEVHPHVLKQFGIEGSVVVCELAMSGLAGLVTQQKSFTAIPEFPGVKRDIAFFVDKKVLYKDLEKVMRSAHDLIVGAELFDVYEGKGVPDSKKSMAFHIEYLNPEKTLSMEEADEAHAALEKALKKLGAEVRK